MGARDTSTGINPTSLGVSSEVPELPGCSLAHGVVPKADDTAMRLSSTPQSPLRISLSLSGGGYRAAAFALGSMLCLVDLNLGTRITLVSSVSGGSITNVFAATNMFRRGEGLNNAETWTRAAKLFEMLSSRTILSPVLIFARVGSSLLSLVAIAIVIAFVLNQPSRLFSAPLVISLGLMLLPIGYWTYRTLGSVTTRRIGLYLNQAQPEWEAPSGRDALRAALNFTLYLYTLRWRKAAKEFGRVFSMTGQWDSTTMSDLTPSYRPVFCTTDLGSGTHFYVSDRFVAGAGPILRGASLITTEAEIINLVGAAPSWPVASAVMASAAFRGNSTSLGERIDLWVAPPKWCSTVTCSVGRRRTVR